MFWEKNYWLLDHACDGSNKVTSMLKIIYRLICVQWLLDFDVENK